MKVALLSCTSRKKNYPCRASEMYSESSRFRLAYQYAKKTSDKIYILSAKYGLISEYEVIKPYNEALKDKSSKERLLWSNNVILSMKNKFLLDSDEFTIIAGKIYVSGRCDLRAIISTPSASCILYIIYNQGPR